MNCLLVVATQIPENAMQTASLWAIRLAMLLLVLVLSAEILGKKKTNPAWASLWLLGGSRLGSSKRMGQSFEGILGIFDTLGLYALTH